MAIDNNDRSSITPELMTALEALKIFLDSMAESNKTQAEILAEIKNITSALESVKNSQVKLSGYFNEAKGFPADMDEYIKEIIVQQASQNKRTLTILGSIVTIITTVFGFLIWLLTSSPIAELKEVIDEIIKKGLLK